MCRIFSPVPGPPWCRRSLSLLLYAASETNFLKGYLPSERVPALMPPATGCGR